jgi:hypothetical protein
MKSQAGTSAGSTTVSAVNCGQTSAVIRRQAIRAIQPGFPRRVSRTIPSGTSKSRSANKAGRLSGAVNSVFSADEFAYQLWRKVPLPNFEQVEPATRKAIAAHHRLGVTAVYENHHQRIWNENPRGGLPYAAVSFRPRRCAGGIALAVPLAFRAKRKKPGVSGAFSYGHGGHHFWRPYQSLISFLAWSLA